MSQSISCIHQVEGAKYLSCNTCNHNLEFRVFSFDEIGSLVYQILAHVFESPERTWDHEKTRFYVNLVSNEAIVNAVEHGILGLGLEKKKQVIKETEEGYTKYIQDRWLEKGEPVTVSLCVDSERILLGYHDGGKGFDYTDCSPEPFSDHNILEPSGKGLAMLKGLGIVLHWNKKGNSLLCAIRDETLRGSKRQVNLDEIFRLGLDEFDNQHKILFAIVNEVFDNIFQEQNKDATGKVLARLLDYTVEHFTNEEELMRKLGYPNYESHKKQHEFLSSRIKEIYLKFKTEDVTVNEETLSFLVKWVLHHIARVDKDYVPFLKSKGIQ